MYIHAVHFRVRPDQAGFYRKDSLMWARYAKKYPGFKGYYTMQRLGYKNQYISVYSWQKKAQCDRFMQELHDPLVLKSRAKVKVLGYYNLSLKDRSK